MQREGVAAALEHPAVASAILSQAPIMLAVFEFHDVPVPLLSMTPIRDSADIAAAAAVIRSAPRGGNGQTGLGLAIQYGVDILADQPCDRRVLDVSGDEASNYGPHPNLARAAADAAGVTINALPIGSAEIAYRRDVQFGDQSFTMPATSFEDFGPAMFRKLLSEVLS